MIVLVILSQPLGVPPLLPFSGHLGDLVGLGHTGLTLSLAVPVMASRGRWRASGAAQSCPARTRSPSERRSPTATARPLAAGGACFLPRPQESRHSEPPPGAMASPPGSPEDAGKLRGGREGRQRREDDAPEQKRLRLGLRAGSEPQDGATAPCPTPDELATHTGGEGRSVSEPGHLGRGSGLR